MNLSEEMMSQSQGNVPVVTIQRLQAWPSCRFNECPHQSSYSIKAITRSKQSLTQKYQSVYVWKSVLSHYTEPFYSIRLWGTNSKLYSIPGGSMKSKCTRSSIPSFLSCSTTEPKFDLRISGYVLSWGEMKINKEKGKQISWCSLLTPSSCCSWGNIQTHLVDMDIFHCMCTKRWLEVARSTKDLWRNQGLAWPLSSSAVWSTNDPTNITGI